jgi:hypothetical protein
MLVHVNCDPTLAGFKLAAFVTILEIKDHWRLLTNYFWFQQGHFQAYFNLNKDCTGDMTIHRSSGQKMSPPPPNLQSPEPAMSVVPGCRTDIMFVESWLFLGSGRMFWRAFSKAVNRGWYAKSGFELSVRNWWTGTFGLFWIQLQRPTLALSSSLSSLS